MSASSKNGDRYFVITGIIRVTAQVELLSLRTGGKYYFKAGPSLDALKEVKVGDIVQIRNGVLIKKRPSKKESSKFAHFSEQLSLIR